MGASLNLPCTRHRTNDFSVEMAVESADPDLQLCAAVTHYLSHKALSSVRVWLQSRTDLLFLEIQHALKNGGNPNYCRSFEEIPLFKAVQHKNNKLISLLLNYGAVKWLEAPVTPLAENVESFATIESSDLQKTRPKQYDLLRKAPDLKHLNDFMLPIKYVPSINAKRINENASLSKRNIIALKNKGERYCELMQSAKYKKINDGLDNLLNFEIIHHSSQSAQVANEYFESHAALWCYFNFHNCQNDLSSWHLTRLQNVLLLGGDIDDIENLLKLGANPNLRCIPKTESGMQDRQGFTPLHIALCSTKVSLKMVQLLVRYGANPALQAHWQNHPSDPTRSPTDSNNISLESAFTLAKLLKHQVISDFLTNTFPQDVALVTAKAPSASETAAATRIHPAHAAPLRRRRTQLSST